MSDKYHIDINGEAVVCPAQIQCRKTDSEGQPAPHFTGSKQDAQEWAEKENAREMGGNLTTRRKPNNSAVNSVFSQVSDLKSKAAENSQYYTMSTFKEGTNLETHDIDFANGDSIMLYRSNEKNYNGEEESHYTTYSHKTGEVKEGTITSENASDINEFMSSAAHNAQGDVEFKQSQTYLSHTARSMSPNFRVSVTEEQEKAFDGGKNRYVRVDGETDGLTFIQKDSIDLQGNKKFMYGVVSDSGDDGPPAYMKSDTQEEVEKQTEKYLQAMKKKDANNGKGIIYDYM